MKEVITIIKTLNLNRETTAILENAYGIGYEKQDNTIWSASFSLPINDPKVEKVKLLRYVEIPDSDGKKHLYRIIPKLTSSSNNSVTFQCEHVLATLLGVTLFKYHQLTNYTTRESIEYLLARQNHKHWKLGRCAFTRYFHYSWENENLLSAIFSVPKPLDHAYQWNFDTSTYPWTLHLDEPETTPTCRIREGYNLVNFELEENPMSVFNRIYPLGAGEGVNQLTIESVNNGIPYIEDIGPDEEIMETTWADKRFEDPELLKASAEGLLKKWKQPTITWKTKAADVSEITGLEIDKLKQGKVLRLELKNYPLTELRIMKERRNDITGNPGDVQLEIGNVLEDLSTTNADLERRQQINELYSQGATNILNSDRVENADPEHPIKFKIRIPEAAVHVNWMELTWETDYFRGYTKGSEAGGQFIQESVVQSKSTEGGGAYVQESVVRSESTEAGGAYQKPSEVRSVSSPAGGNHYHKILQFNSAGPNQLATLKGYMSYQKEQSFSPAVNLETTADGNLYTFEADGDHTHNFSITIPGMNIEPHTHGFSVTIPGINIPPHVHNFSVTIPAINIEPHTHKQIYGIYEHDQLPSSLEIKVDGNVIPQTSLQGESVDIVPYLAKDSNGNIQRGRFAEVEIRPTDDLAQITANIIWGLFIRSHKGVTL